MEPWPIDYFKLEDFWENRKSRRITLPFCPETDQKTLLWDMPSLYLEERKILLSEGKGKPNKQILLSFPQSPALIYPLSYHTPHDSPLFKLSIHQKVCFRCLWRLSCHITFIWNKSGGKNLYAFLLLICLCHFNFQAQPETLTGSRKPFSSSTQP